MLVLKSLYRKQVDRIDAYQSAGMPIYVLRSASVERLREALVDLFRADRMLPGGVAGSELAGGFEGDAPRAPLGES